MKTLYFIAFTELAVLVIFAPWRTMDLLACFSLITIVVSILWVIVSIVLAERR